VTMKRGVIVLIVVVLALVLGGCEFVGVRNKLAVEKEAITGQWSQVDADLQRRADLIPNLVETVKGFTKEESSVYANIAQARDGLMNAQGPQAKIAANGQLDNALAKVLVLTENYPQLRSSEQFMRLQDELAGTENRIAVSRMRYNNAIQDYNTFILQFPNNIWANMAGYRQNTAYFTASPAAQAVPSVKF
ncbi:MAG: LemA family protein, partial [Terracidiphilus sp.]